MLQLCLQGGKGHSTGDSIRRSCFQCMQSYSVNTAPALYSIILFITVAFVKTLLKAKSKKKEWLVYINLRCWQTILFVCHSEGKDILWLFPRKNRNTCNSSPYHHHHHHCHQTCREFYQWTSKCTWYFSWELVRVTQCPGFLLGNCISFSLSIDSYDYQKGDLFLLP